MSGAWFSFDPASLEALARARREEYREAAPFPHLVVDDFLPDDVASEVVAEFPEPDDGWRRFADEKQRKYGAGHEVPLGPRTRNVLAEFNGGPFVDFVQTLTGIEEPLISDPQLKGGGLHQILPGGYLAVHADFNRHPLYGLDRRVNVLFYLNQGWEPEWGGQLELWDRTMSRAERVIDPIFNRLVVFTITDVAYHGHPEPLRCPADRARRSLAFYYYSNGRPAPERSESHSTLWQRRPVDRGAPDR